MATPQWQHGLKIVTRHTAYGRSTERTEYMQIDRKRGDYRPEAGYQVWSGGPTVYARGPHMAFITRCDLKQQFQVNLDRREYEAASVAPFHPPEELVRGAAAPPVQWRRATVIVETTTVDTGQRKRAFGYTARHVMTTRREARVGSANGEPNDTRTDGWYIDLETSIPCDPSFWYSGRVHAHAFLTIGQAKRDGAVDYPAVEFRDVGTPESGYPIEMHVTGRSRFAMPDGTPREQVWTDETLVTELSSAPLDQALFEIPAGFRRVEHVQQDPSPPLWLRVALAWQQLTWRLANLEW